MTITPDRHRKPVQPYLGPPPLRAPPLAACRLLGPTDGQSPRLGVRRTATKAYLAAGNHGDPSREVEVYPKLNQPDGRRRGQRCGILPGCRIHRNGTDSTNGACPPRDRPPRATLSSPVRRRFYPRLVCTRRDTDAGTNRYHLVVHHDPDAGLAICQIRQPRAQRRCKRQLGPPLKQNAAFTAGQLKRKTIGRAEPSPRDGALYRQCIDKRRLVDGGLEICKGRFIADQRLHPLCDIRGEIRADSPDVARPRTAEQESWCGATVRFVDRRHATINVMTVIRLDLKSHQRAIVDRCFSRSYAGRSPVLSNDQVHRARGPMRVNVE